MDELSVTSEIVLIVGHIISRNPRSHWEVRQMTKPRGEERSLDSTGCRVLPLQEHVEVVDSHHDCLD